MANPINPQTGPGSSRPAPQVQTGFRDSVDRNPVRTMEDSAQAASSLASSLKSALLSDKASLDYIEKQAVSKEEVFESRCCSLRVQITSPADRMDPSTGYIIRGMPVFAQFRQGIFKTSDPMTIDRLKTNTKSYGVGRLYWSAVDMRAATKIAAVQQISETIQAMPELVPVLKQILEGEGFALPTPPAIEATA